jgi:hypothetical protein
MRYLVLSSILFFLFISCSSSKILVKKESEKTPFWTSELRDDTLKNDYQITISTSKISITGILIVKQIEGKWRGTIINEFGIKVLDFESSAQKCKLKNVISFIDKGYIKKVLASDIQFIMEIDNPNYKIGFELERIRYGNAFGVRNKKRNQLLRFFEDNTIKYFNRKRGLTYSLVKILSNSSN